MTAGIAYGKVTSSAGFTTTNTAYITLTGLGPVWGTAGSFSSTRTGWTIGGGGEWKFATNFSLKVEYLYYDLGSTNYSIGTSGAPVRSGAQAGLPWFTNASTASTRFDGNIVRVGLNYEFGYAPASAAYK
jgi:outer membrane immunogenic protein